MSAAQVRLTQLTHGGGGGCKVAPDILEKILSGIKPGIVPPQLLIGKENSDDAAVYQLSAQQAIVATTDFFTPIVDDPFDFGRIAATTAISNVYAMGATPLFALALVGMPVSLLPLETIGKVLEGGESVCRLASIPVAGGHTIDSMEPIRAGGGRPGQSGPSQAQRHRPPRRPADFGQAARYRRVQYLSLIHI